MCDQPVTAVRRRQGWNTPSVAEAICREHFERIVRLVRGHIARRFRSKIDAEDIANSVLKSFFRGYITDGPTDWEALWGLLAQIALNKLRNRVRDFSRRKRDVGREMPEGESGFNWGGEDLARGHDHGPHRPADPGEEVVIRDLCDHLLGDLSDDKRRVVELSLQGYPVAEIAENVGLSERTVCRIREQFKRRLEEERDR